MANLDRIQQLLNTSEDYQTRFLQDPVAALAQEGLLLSFAMQQDIRQQVRQLAAASGAAVGAGSAGQVTTLTSRKAPQKKVLYMEFKFREVLISGVI